MSNNQTTPSDLEKYFKLGYLLRTIGIILIIAAVIWWVIVRFIEINGHDTGILIIIANWHIAAILIGLFLFFRGKQYLTKAKAPEFTNDDRPPVVYLRPFSKDTKTISRVLPGLLNPVAMLSALSPIEEQMSKVVQPIGPFVALAHPGKSLPTPGVAAYQSSHEEWQSLVSELLERAKLVIIQPGSTEGVLWEIEQAFKFLKPDQLILFFHKSNKHKYQKLSDEIKSTTGRALPDFKGNGTFLIGFDKDWKPKLLNMKVPIMRRSNFSNWRRMFNAALEPVFRNLNVEWHPNTISLQMVIVVSLFSLIILFLLMLILTA